MGLFSKRGSKRKTQKKNSKQKKRSKPNDKKPRQKSKGSRTPTDVSVGTPEKDKNLKDEGGKKVEKMKKKKKDDSRTEDFREQQEDAVKDDEDVQPSKGLIPTRFDQDMNLEVTSRDVDETEVERVFRMFTAEKKNATRITAPIDEKSKLLMDRMPAKKPYPSKYNKDNGLFLVDERSSFFTKTPDTKKIPQGSADTYDQYRKLADVRKMTTVNVLNEDGIPFWAVNPEPNEEELSSTAPAISIGSEHLELYRHKQITLHTIKNTKLVLNEIQPLSEMMKRDDIHFTPELVFSNTIRSLINSQRMDGETRKESKLDENRKSDRLKIEDKKPEEYVYLSQSD
ncbi:DNA-directed RNA polymerase III subunit RPC5 [Caenorhabditis elegans]|uniref:DNA-directed RNA polymerase III subunit RPC5 n=1 Tax=Caenorhabditis elegans TaxID=6239 RepID=Q17565_CAEEL|nr:DNA-directed RNA polymerase III subunit RPC5 [Caenorhabditis elegans]CCD62444.2 DNA-directed RNA polymerase III subunit RPC5 [Caenorhabditis elegans]|eukprot:NP_500996.2 Uncharacterized protein CELE_C01G5.3 [Caenorhabditis elegans]